MYQSDLILECKNEPNIDENLHFSDFFWPGDHHHFQPGDGRDVGLLLLLATSDIFSNPVTGISEEICYGSSSRNIHKAVQSQVNSYIHMMPGMPADDFLPCDMVCPTATWMPVMAVILVMVLQGWGLRLCPVFRLKRQSGHSQKLIKCSRDSLIVCQNH